MLNSFQQQLAALGYEVKRVKNQEILKSLKCVYALNVLKITGSDRCDCNGGYLLVRSDGKYQYDFFVGGCKYGMHFNNFPPSGKYWNKKFPSALALDFLS